MKRIALFSLILVGLFLVACGEQPQTQTKDVFFGGTNGVEAKFELMGGEQDNIDTVYDTDSFLVEVTLNNKGEQELAPGDAKVRLLGLPPVNFQGIASWELSNKDIVDKVSELNKAGGQETLSFGSAVKYLPKITTYADLEWIAEVTYQYQTHIRVDNVCFKGNLNDKRVCEVIETKKFHVSGAPITVTSAKEDTAGSGIVALTLEVKNANPGKSTKGPDFNTNFNTFGFTIDEPELWDCKSAGKIGEGRFDETGAALITCKLKNPLAKGDLYTKNIGLTLDYKYQSLAQTKLRVKESQ